MSLILDALNRSRSETGDVPRLDAVHGAEPAAGRNRAWLPWVGLALALAVIAWLLLDGRGTPDAPPLVIPEPATTPAAKLPPTVTPDVTESPAAAVAQAPVVSRAATPVAPAPVPDSEPAASVTPVATPDPEVAALYASPEEVATPSIARPDADTIEQAAKPEPTASAEPEPAMAPAAQEQAVDIEQMILQAEDELENARLAEHPAPFISGLSQRVKDDIPTLLYERHDYSGRPGESRVVLNGQSLARGGTTRGVRVEEILPDSVVLRYRDTQFRLRALNSWVNL